MSLHRILRPGGRFILRDMASNSRVVMWLINHIEVPIANKVMHKGTSMYIQGLICSGFVTQAECNWSCMRSEKGSGIIAWSGRGSSVIGNGIP